MKKHIYSFILLMFILLIVIPAHADLSSNLKVVKEINPATRKTTQETYVDSQGNPIVASDKGYASVSYTYNGSNLLTEISFLDADGQKVNSTEGYACVQYAYLQRNVIRTAYLDASGAAVTGPEGYAVQEIKRGNRGVAKETFEYDAEGKLQRRCATEYVDEKRSNLIKSQTWYDEENELTAGPEGYARVIYEYNKRKKSHVAYYKPDGSLFFNAKDGYAEMEEIYDKGVVKELHYYGEERQLIAGPKGFARATYSYAKGGDEILTMYYNADGSLFFTNKGYCGIKQLYKNKKVVDESYYVDEGVRGYSTDGYSRTTLQYTMWRTIGYQCYYNDKDNLMCPENIGYAKIKNIYNSRYLVRTEYYGVDNKLMLGPDGYAVVEHIIKNKLNVKDVFYDVDGKTVINGKDGYASIEYKYNDVKQCVGQTFFEAEGNSVQISGEADEVRLAWKGNQIIGESYWKDEEPVAGAKGYHEVRREYTTSGKINTEFYYDENGSLTLSADGYAGTEKLYNSKGREMTTLYYNEQGGLMLTPGKEYAYILTLPMQDKMALTEEEKEEVSEEEAEEEETTEDINEETEDIIASSITYIEYYGTDRKLMNLSTGYAYGIRETDAQGRIIRERYYDKDGNNAALKAGYDEYRQYYTEGKKPSRIEYYLNSKPALFNDNYAAIEREYDEKGNIAAEKYFNTDLAPAACKSGYEMIRKEYNEENRVCREYYFDHDGNPMVNLKKVYQTAYEYNETGKVILETYYDAYSEPMYCKDQYAGLEKIYNSKGEVTATLYYDTESNLMLTAGKEYAYIMTISGEKEDNAEESGKTIRVEYYGTDRKLMNLSAGYAWTERSIDDRGRITGEKYYDKDGNPAVINSGYDEYRQYYTNGVKPYRYEYYLNGKPVLLAAGYAAVERAYDDNGNIKEEKYYDASLEPTPCKFGYEMIRKEYNEQKQVVQEAYFDHNGAPMTNINGVYITAYEYNENGKAIREMYYDADGTPMLCPGGYAGIGRKYNSRDVALTKVYYDTNGQLMLTPGKEYAYMITVPAEERNQDNNTDNDNIQTVFVEYYGTDDELMNTSSGHAYIMRQTDAQGRVVREVYYDRDDQKVVRKSNYDEIRNVYSDDMKKPFRSEYYLNDQPTLIPEGYAAIEREYDENGNIIVERYFDTEFKPAPNNKGYETVKKEYNEDKKVIKETYYSHTGEAMVNNKGVYQTIYDYNEQGKVIRETYYDADGQTMGNINGYYMIEREYDGEGNKISETNYPIE